MKKRKYESPLCMMIEGQMDCVLMADSPHFNDEVSDAVQLSKPFNGGANCWDEEEEEDSTKYIWGLAY